MMRLFLILPALLAAISTPALAESWSSTCPGEGHTLSLNLESELELRDSLLPPVPERKEFFQEAMLLQLRYHRKATEEKWKKAGELLVPATETPVVELIGEHHATAKFSYEITPISHPDVKIESPYLLAALAKEKLQAGEPVTKLRFRGSWKAMTCVKTAGGKLPEATATLAPLDPFLAFWLAPVSSRQLFKWERSEFVLSPAFDSEYADIPDPYYGWYFWRPDFSGKDKFGNDYTSRAHLDEGANASAATITVAESASSPFLKLSHAKPGSLKATAIFGVIELKKEIWKPELTFAKRSGNQKDWPKIQKELLDFHSREGIDNGSKYAVDFLANIHFFLDVSKFTWRYDPKKLVLTINGRLFESRKALRFRFYFGPTDLLVQVPPQHWNLSVDALKNDDVVIYHGHSGLGENFKKQNIEKLSNSKIGAHKKDQILLIASCYSYSYYSDFTEPKQLLLTGTDYGGAGIPIGLLSWFDRFYGDSEAAIGWVAPGDFLILRAR